MAQSCEYPIVSKCASPSQRAGHPPEANGCGAKGGRRYPESYKKANFREVCDAHDVCYGTCGSKKVDCDFEFIKGILRVCDRSYNWITSIDGMICIQIAQAYFRAVSDWGHDAFEAAQDDVCECCRDSLDGGADASIRDAGALDAAARGNAGSDAANGCDAGTGGEAIAPLRAGADYWQNDAYSCRGSSMIAVAVCVAPLVHEDYPMQASGIECPWNGFHNICKLTYPDSKMNVTITVNPKKNYQGPECGGGAINYRSNTCVSACPP